MVTVFIGIELFGICIIFLALGLLLFGQDSREQRFMAYFMGGALIQNCGYLLELLAVSQEAAVVAVKMQYLGSLFVPILYCRFIYYYCYEKVPKRILRVLSMINLITLVVVFFCDKHTLYYREINWLVTDGGHGYLSMEYGLWYGVFMLFSCVLPYALSFVALVHATVSRPQQAVSRKYRLILTLSFLPVFALGAYVLKLTSIFDLTPAALGIVLSLVVILVWRKRTYDFRSLASEIVLNSMGDGVLTLNDKKQIVHFNQAAVAIFPELSEDSIGEGVSVLQGFPREGMDAQEKQEFCRSGHFYESHVQQITDKKKGNQGYVILILDVTETKKYIEEIKSVREQAERANMAKSEFLANMSHEIRTPMNAIVGLSDIIMEESRGRKVYSYANNIKTASYNLLSIINDILDLSKVEAGKMELVFSDYYIKSLVSAVTGIMDVNASLHGLLLKYEYDTSIPCRYNGDEGRIRQILINLLNNAVKFTKEGYVKLSVGGTPGEDGMENLLFKVEDTGCGIKEEDLELIFEDFKQADSKKNRSVEGTGLGLSITKRLVELMKGTIEVESTYGKGTVFTVMLPQRVVDSRSLLEVPEVLETQQEENRLFQVKGEYNVLVVDDNLVNRRVALGFLKRYGFRIFEAGSGPDAIAQVKKMKFQLIFMDHMMPEMDGVETVQVIRRDCGKNGTDPVIIALTANAMEGVRNLFLQNGFQDFLAKPLYRKPINEILLKWIPESERVYVEEEEEKEGAGMDFSDIAIPGIDIDEAILHHTGEVSDYIEILKLYCTDGKRKLPYLRELAGKGDLKTYGVEVHGLKSASANIGAMELSAQAKTHEFAVKDGQTDYILEHYQELLSNYEKMLGFIQNFLKQTGETNPKKQGERPVLEKAELLKEIKEALALVEGFQPKECAARIDRLLEGVLEEGIKNSLEETREQLRLYEDDEAEKILRDLIARLEREE